MSSLCGLTKGQGREPLLVEAFVAELAIEAFDVAVLHWAAGLDRQMFEPPSRYVWVGYRQDLRHMDRLRALLDDALLMSAIGRGCVKTLRPLA